MPYKVTKYACSICHRVFDTYEEASRHEEACNKCNSCKHAYYAYGCEFGCEYLSKCRYPAYTHYEKKETKKV